MRPISKDPCMAFEILENGKKVKRNRKKEKDGEQKDRDIFDPDPELSCAFLIVK